MFKSAKNKISSNKYSKVGFSLFAIVFATAGVYLLINSFAVTFGSALPALLPESMGTKLTGDKSVDLDTLFANLKPGDTLCLHGGVYGQGITTAAALKAIGTATNPITIESCAGETAEIARQIQVTGSYIRLRNLKIIKNSYPTDVRYGQSGINPGGNVGIWLKGGTSITVEKSEITGATMTGIFGGGPNNQIISNYIHNNGTTPDDHGIYYTSGSSLIANNLVVDNFGFGVQVQYTGATNDIVANNTVIHNGYGGVSLGKPGSGFVTAAGTSNIRFVNNIAANNAEFGFKTYDTTSVLSNNNTYGNVSGSTYGTFASNTVTSLTNPLFISATDFHLQGTSPAINVGDTAYTPPTDYDGKTRTTADLGAYGYINASTPPVSQVVSTCTTTLSPGGDVVAAYGKLTAGQTLCLRAGLYSTYEIRTNNNGTTGSPITLMSYPGERATITVNNVYLLGGQTYHNFTNLNIVMSGTSNQNVMLQDFSDNSVWQGNDISGINKKTCMELGYGSSIAHNTSIKNNRFHDCGNPADGNQDHAIYLSQSVGANITENLFWNTAAFAIHLYPNADNSTVTHNVIDSSGYGGVIFASDQTATGLTSDNNTIAYNMITNGPKYGMTAYWGPAGVGKGNAAHDNCNYGNTNNTDGLPNVTLTNNISGAADPYTNATNRDYTLNSSSNCKAVVQYDSAAIVNSLFGVSSTTPPPPLVTPPPADITAPTLTLTPANGATGLTGTVAITATADDAGGISHVDFFIDGSSTALSIDTSAPYMTNWNASAANNGTHTITAIVYDNASPANSKSVTNTATVTNLDTIKPTASTNLSATPASPTAVSLSWTAATDNIGVTGYLVQRNGVVIKDTLSTATTFSDTTAMASTTYTYNVVAYDGAKNPSPASNTATATTPAPPAPVDTTPPPAPANLSAVISPTTSNQVNLSWLAVTDPSGIKGYNIYRGTTKLNTTPVTTTTYGDGTVAAGTSYSYTVSAVDGVNLEGAKSNTSSVTTPLPPPVSTVTTLSFNPTDDAFVNSRRGNRNYGKATSLVSENSPLKYSLYKFNVSGVGTRQIKSAKLRLYVNNGSRVGGALHQTNSNTWTQSTVTWKNKPSFNAANLSTLRKVTRNTWVETDVTSLVTNDGVYGILINSTSGDTAGYASRETTTKPQLILGVQ